MPSTNKQTGGQREDRRESENARGKMRGNKLLKRLQFEMMISSLSTSLINVTVENFDHEIESGLRNLTKFIGFERATLHQKINTGQFQLTHAWERNDFLPPLETFITDVRYPSILNYLKKKKKPLCLSSLDVASVDHTQDVAKLKDLGMKSIIVVPLIAGGTLQGFLASGSFRKEVRITDELKHRFRLVGDIFANALLRKRAEKSLNEAFAEIKHLKDQLEAECTYLREEIKLANDFSHVIGKSPAMKKVLLRVEQVAATEATVLILGETGTGKELIARSLHNISPRRNRPFVKVDCASLPANLIENELFGHEKGAFTGADTKKIGRMEIANSGTVFLDEIGELPLDLQSNMLRVLQESTFERLGGVRTIKVDIRIIAATNRDLRAEVRNGNFREDLWYRLNVFPISIPPLRERKEDIPLLVEWNVKQSGKKLGKKIEKISNSALDILRNYTWPGNIRELENVITRAIITSPEKTLQIESFNEIRNLLTTCTEQCMTLAEIEREHILNALKITGWKIQGPNGAAEVLGLKPTTLRDRMKKRGIRRPVVT